MTRRGAAVLATLSVSIATAPVARGQQRPAPQPRAAAAQPAQPRLLVMVVDQTGAVLPTATVKVSGIEDATRQKTIEPAQASDQGIAIVTGLAPGRYSIEAEFPGFEPNMIKDTRVRAGDNRVTITLALEKLTDSITVAQDAAQAASDPHGSSFGTALSKDQIDALSDDPDTLAQQLQDLGGPDATIRVDSFEGGQLPPKSQIKSIHVTRDGFAAENHSAGQIFVEIITQPGVGPIRGNFNTRIRDGGLSGRNQITNAIQPELTEDGFLNFGGSLIRQRASFSLQLSGTNAFVKPILNVALPTGELASIAGQKQTTDRLGVYGAFDYAITKDQTLRLSYNQFSTSNDNLGVGQYDLPERAYSSSSQSYQFRAQEVGPLGRRWFGNTRLSINVTGSDSQSDVQAPTIRVLDAFTSGGAQVGGGRHGKAFTFQSDADYVRGIHSVRTGVLLDGGWYRSDSTSNYLGTYTFADEAGYEAGTPLNFSQRIGDPTVSYFTMQSSFYAQDDIRVRKSLTISPGVRYELQTHLGDKNAVGPRLGITWSPFKGGHTTLRSSAGIFYDWLIPDTYEQTLRNDGVRQQQVNIDSPAYPNPGNVALSPSDRYLLGPGLHFQHYRRVSAGVDQTIGSRVRLSTTYAYVLGDSLWRGDNLNAPVNGVRPDPAFANVIEVVGDAGSHQHQLTTNLQVGLAGLTPQNPFAQGGPLFDWKKLSLNSTYTLGKFTNNTDNRFAVPPTGNINLEWGPAPNDVRNRLYLAVTSTQVRNLNATAQLNASSGTPYSLTTGFDDNGDGLITDRPAGVGRNTLRTPGQWTLNTFFAYTLALGSATVGGVQGVGINSGPGGSAPVVTTFNGAPPRYRLAIFVQVYNLTNHPNYGGYSGTLTSEFLEQPTLVLNPRKVDLGFSLSF